MELKPGARLGSYEIVGPLGSGGMGDVYRARDTKLGRAVAVKVLPPSVALDAGRLARFEQEARAAGALSHPNLVTVHEFGVADGSPFIVMELLEGETLRSRLSGSTGGSRTTRAAQSSSTPGGAPPPGEGHALPLRKSLDYATQIASGLAAAHEKGIVHRDLKPENIVIEPDGRVKILDFGLAKISAPQQLLDGEGETGVAAGTAPGTVLGTVGYMSPEQVRGEEADHRSDIFALGAILYEMLTGHRAFRGATSVDTLHAILRDEPPALASPGQLPPSLARLVQRCLEKSPGERFQSARDLAFSLADVSSGSGESGSALAPATSRKPGRWVLPAALAVGGLAAGLALGWIAFKAPAPPPLRFDVLTYSGTDIAPAASPDGKTIAFSSARTGARRIWLKQVTGGGETALTAGPFDTSPRFSPDGSTLVFQRTEEGRASWYRVAVLGGDERRVFEDVVAADWSPDGSRLAFVRATETGAVVGTARADGTDRRDLATLQDARPISLRWSPDGRWLACMLVPPTGMTARALKLVPTDGGQVRTLSTPAGARADELNRALAWNGDSREVFYVERAPGAAGGTVIAHDVGADRGRALFSILGSSTTVDVLASGVLLFDAILQAQNLRAISLDSAAGAGSASVTWLTRGRSVDRQPTFSPDGQSVVFASNRAGNLDLWSLSTRDGTLRRLTDDASADWDPAYAPDGRDIVWSSDRNGNYEIWMAAADGSGARQVSSDGFDAENPSMTPDGRWIVYSSAHPEKRGLWKVRPDGTEATQIAAGQFTIPEVSPDGRYVAFLAADTDGRRPILVHRLGDGKPVPFTIVVERRGTPDNNFGRMRWMPEGRALAFWAVDTDGVAGVFVQDFAESGDTTSTRRRLAGFDRDVVAESFGIAPDGSTIVVSGSVRSADVLVADGVAGVVKR